MAACTGGRGAATHPRGVLPAEPFRSAVRHGCLSLLKTAAALAEYNKAPDPGIAACSLPSVCDGTMRCPPINIESSTIATLSQPDLRPWQQSSGAGEGRIDWVRCSSMHLCKPQRWKHTNTAGHRHEFTSAKMS
jgi:hypothetical protein